jgi:hypothetical protein
MATLAQIRAQYPQYHDMSDGQLADALYAKHYSDMPRDQFNKAVGLNTAPVEPGSLGMATPPEGLKPGSPAYANWARDQTVAGHAVPQVSGAPPAAGYSPSAVPWMDQINAGASNFVNNIPVIGAPLADLANKGDAAINNALGFPTETAADRAKINAGDQAQYPVQSMVGGVAGAVAPYVLAGGIPGVARAIGMDAAAPLGEQMVRSAATQAVVSSADAAVRGETPGDVLLSGGLGGLGGILGPAVGAAAGQVVKGAGKLLGGARDLVQGAIDPAGVAARQVGTGIAQDVAAGGTALSAADRAQAAAIGQPLVNADNFGSQTKGVLQSSMPLAPEADANAARAVAANRGTGASKAMNGYDFLNNALGKFTDSNYVQNMIAAAKKTMNPQAYDAAYAHPNAGSIWNDNLANMVNTSQTFQDAIKMTTKTAGNDAAAHGTTAIKNPFRFNSDGSYQIAQGQTPSLPFWDQVQRNLRTLAKNEGGYDGANILQMRTNLNNELDAAVPQFQTAREGAASFFGAENAHDAGQKYALSNQDPNEIAAAFGQLSPVNKQLFGAGLVSKYVNRLNDASIPPSAVDKIFTPGSKSYQQLQLGLSGFPPNVAAQLPAFSRVSQAMTDTNTAIKNASAQRVTNQLAGYAGKVLPSVIGGAAGEVLGGGSPLDWAQGRVNPQALMGAAVLGGAKMLGSNVDKAVSGRIVQMLSSGDPAAIHNAVVYATRNPKAGAALKAIQHGVASMVGRGVQAAAAPAAATAAPMLAPPIAAAAQPDPSQAPAQ